MTSIVLCFLKKVLPLFPYNSYLKTYFGASSASCTKQYRIIYSPFYMATALGSSLSQSVPLSLIFQYSKIMVDL